MFLASSSWRTISTSKIRKKFNGLTNLTVYFGIYFRGSCENLVFFIELLLEKGLWDLGDLLAPR
jgi:hypothetical protein